MIKEKEALAGLKDLARWGSSHGRKPVSPSSLKRASKQVCISFSSATQESQRANQGSKKAQDT